MEKKETNTLSIFQRPVWVSLFALTAAISWGWAYPLIKMGMEEYQITADMTGSKMLFAGILSLLKKIQARITTVKTLIELSIAERAPALCESPK